MALFITTNKVIFRLRNLLITLSIFSSTWFSHLDALKIADTSVIWPAGAINIWLVLRYGLSVFFPCLLGYELYHFFFIDDYGFFAPLLSATKILSCWFAVSLYQSVSSKPRDTVLADARSLLSFLVFAAAIMSVSSSVTGNAVLSLFNTLHILDLWPEVLWWAISDFTAVILICPCLLLIGSDYPRLQISDYGLEIFVAFATLGLVMGVCWSSFSAFVPPLLVILPTCVWLSLKQNTRFITLILTVLILSFLAIDLSGSYDFSKQDVVLIPLYCAFLMIACLLLHISRRESQCRGVSGE